ncbi:MAG: hypothetical protein HZA68_03145 [Rhodovulum sp.]|nr:hypothetical protein [Rhodovulum sp.]
MTDTTFDKDGGVPRATRLGVQAERILLPVAVVVALAIGIVARIVGEAGPLWIDEAVTGVVAAQPDLRAMAAMALQDPNAPLFYALAHAWAGVAGLDDAALRTPSLAAALLTPFIVLLPNPALDRNQRLLWGALLALAWPSLMFAQEARSYALLLALATATTVAFLRLVATPSLGRALLWTSLGTLTILNHYLAAVVVGLQGLAYLALCGRRALRTWPAVLVVLPAVAWLTWHGPTLARFADPAHAWYQLVELRHMSAVATFLFGTVELAAWTLAIATLMLLRGLVAGMRRRVPSSPTATPATVAVVVSVAAAALMLGLGAIRPSFTLRYLVPCVPGILLGAALVAVEMSRRVPASGLVYVLLFGMLAVRWAADGSVPGYKRDLETQSGSRTLMAAGVERVAFVWDNPLFGAMDPRFARALGGFFFHRAGMPVAVEVFQGADIARLDAWTTAAGPRSGLIWIHEPELNGPLAAHFPPAAAGDPAWRCTRTGAGVAGRVAPGVLTCVRN